MKQEQTTLHHGLQAMKKQFKEIDGLFSEMKMLWELNRPEYANEISLQLAARSERLAVLMRSIPRFTGVPNADRLVEEAILEAIPIQMGFTAENWFCLRIPLLIPYKERSSTEYIRGYLYPAMERFFKGTERIRYDRCVLVFRHVYDRTRPERQKRNHDSVELNMVVDTIALYLLYDDSPKRCCHHYTSAAGTEERTEVYVVPFENFPDWLRTEPFIPDEGVTLYDRRQSATG